MKYTVFVTRTNKYAVEVEAESAEAADRGIYGIPEEDWDKLDSDDIVEYILDENNREWRQTRKGRYVTEKK